MMIYYESIRYIFTLCREIYVIEANIVWVLGNQYFYSSLGWDSEKVKGADGLKKLRVFAMLLGP